MSAPERRGIRYGTSPTPSEREVLRLTAMGFTSDEIARVTSRQSSTVRSHREHIYRRLGFDGTRGIAQAIAWAIKNNIVTVDEILDG